jgi:hypothetical protein
MTGAPYSAVTLNVLSIRVAPNWHISWVLDSNPHCVEKIRAVALKSACFQDGLGSIAKKMRKLLNFVARERIGYGGCPADGTTPPRLLGGRWTRPETARDCQRPSDMENPRQMTVEGSKRQRVGATGSDIKNAYGMGSLPNFNIAYSW